MKNTPERIVFFDGVCNLCNQFVDFLIRRADGHFFAPLQGQTALRLLPQTMTENLPSVVYWRDGQVFTESGAALRILADLGGPWQLIRVLLWVPSPLRNFVYRFIARHRYRWFGQRDTCRLPTPAERARFLD